MKPFFRLRVFIFTCIFAFTSVIPISATMDTEIESSVSPAESTTASIPGWPVGPTIESGAAIVMEADTGTVLYDKNMNMRCYPASITKILTAVLGIENSSLHDMVYFSEENIAAVPRDSSHIAINPGEELSMENCLYGLLLASANECANAIAEHVSGSIPAFVDLMNERAKELGAIDTHFANANGLPDENHYTTCYDMAMISRAAVSNETYRSINGITTYMIPPTNLQPESRPVNSMHHLLLNGSLHYDGCFGGKTGYTSVAGSTLVSFAERDGMTLICVVMKSTSPTCFTESAALLDYGFQSFKKVNIAENETNYTFNNDTFFPSSCSIFNSSTLEIELSKDSVIILPVNASFSDAKAELTFIHSSSSDQKENSNQEESTKQSDRSQLAEITYSFGEHYVGSATLDVLYGDMDAFSFTRTASSQSPSDSETMAANVEPTIQDNSDTASVSPKHVIKINIRYFSAIAFLMLLLAAFCIYLSKTKTERERKRRIRRQKKKQYGSYSRLNMLYRPRRWERRRSIKNRKRDLHF